ncbi:MAG: putative toxin-antitoxin system toxin component, PIN family [Chloroflexota bacterium]|jgi:uncharacterized protein
MKIVIDTNVLISAILRDRIPEEVILFIVDEPGYSWVVSRDILNEYRAVMARPRFGLPETILTQWENVLQRTTVLVDVPSVIDFPRDQKDGMFLSCSLAAEADFLITGDRDFVEAQKLLQTTIISVSMFKRLLMD